jgi:hypothetical protein
MTAKFYTPQEQEIINMLKEHPKLTISEMKMHAGLRNRKEVPHALNGLRVKGILVQTDEQPARYSVSEAQLA